MKLATRWADPIAGKNCHGVRQQSEHRLADNSRSWSRIGDPNREMQPRIAHVWDIEDLEGTARCQC